MMHVGELEDVRPCDVCGRDYAFVVGEDIGQCDRCHRAIAAASLAARRQRERIRQARRELLENARYTWVLYQPRHQSRAPLWHLLAGMGPDDTPLAVCECAMRTERMIEPRDGERRCIHCAAFARRHGIAGPR